MSVVRIFIKTKENVVRSPTRHAAPRASRENGTRPLAHRVPEVLDPFFWLVRWSDGPMVRWSYGPMRPMRPMRPMVPSSLTEGSPWAMQLQVHGRKMDTFARKKYPSSQKANRCPSDHVTKAHGGKMDRLDNYLGPWSPIPRGWHFVLVFCFLFFSFFLFYRKGKKKLSK